jgi:pimeloyl-ACP methyl ester carboxylesterase
MAPAATSDRMQPEATASPALPTPPDQTGLPLTALKRPPRPAPAWAARSRHGTALAVLLTAAVASLAPFPTAQASAAGSTVLAAGAAASDRRTASTTAAAIPATPAATAAGHWEGTIAVPGSPIAVRVDLAAPIGAGDLRQAGGGAWSGTIDIPTQGASHLALTAVEVSGTKVQFTIAGVPGSPAFVGTLAGAALDGTFTQGGASFPFHLGREAVQLPHHPQEPGPPFPYTHREVGYDNGAVHLAGTLTVPPGPRGPFPAVLLITGSGPQNRDEEVFGHKPFLVLADHLTRAGIAVLRVDDRGVGESTGDFAAATTADFATDVQAGVEFLKHQPEVARDRIGLIGHSEGAIIAPLVASGSSDVAFIVLLAGSGVPGSDLLLSQIAAIERAAGSPAATVEKQLELERQVLDLVRTENNPAVLRDMLRPLIRNGFELLTPAEKSALGSNLDGAVENELRASSSPWFRYFIKYDPRFALRLVRVPVLAMGGDRDLQVPAAQNLAEIARALKEAGDKDVTVRQLPGLNHLFQHAPTGSPTEYAGIDETMAPEVLDTITEWILTRFGGAKTAPAGVH